jgi:hypothetical protein
MLEKMRNSDTDYIKVDKFNELLEKFKLLEESVKKISNKVQFQPKKQQVDINNRGSIEINDQPK